VPSVKKNWVYLFVARRGPTNNVGSGLAVGTYVLIALRKRSFGTNAVQKISRLFRLPTIIILYIIIIREPFSLLLLFRASLFPCHLDPHTHLGRSFSIYNNDVLYLFIFVIRIPIIYNVFSIYVMCIVICTRGMFNWTYIYIILFNM